MTPWEWKQRRSSRSRSLWRALSCPATVPELLAVLTYISVFCKRHYVRIGDLRRLVSLSPLKELTARWYFQCSKTLQGTPRTGALFINKVSMISISCTPHTSESICRVDRRKGRLSGASQVRATLIASSRPFTVGLIDSIVAKNVDL
jgi:hypothetical protein